jgi:hypothetical protein
VCERAEAAGGDDARLDAYDQLRQMISWLRLPLVGGAGYGDEARGEGAAGAEGEPGEPAP